MNDQPNHSDHLDSLTENLRRLRPAKSEVDASTVFYQAGFRAGKKQAAPWKPTRALAAGLIAAVVAAPSGFFAGMKASSPVNVAAQPERQGPLHPRPDEAPEKGLASADSTSPSISPVGQANPEDQLSPQNQLSPASPVQPNRDQVAVSTTQPIFTSSLLGYWPGQSFVRLPVDPNASLGRDEAIKHGDPWVPSVPAPSVPAGSSVRKTLAVLDVRALAEAFEVVQ